MENIGDKIKYLRKHKKNMTQKALADITGVSVITICQIENGHQKPKESTLQLLASALDVTPEYITGVSSYPNFKTWLDQKDAFSLSPEQQHAAAELLERFGYVFIPETLTSDFVMSVIDPQGKQKQVCLYHIYNLTKQFVTLFDSSLYLPEQ